jgi:flagellar protein FlbT
MPLKIQLKPHERMIVDGAVITNGSTRSIFFVENNVPLLRERDILGERDADSLCRQIYFVIQLMYIDADRLNVHHSSYWKLVKLLVSSAPGLTGLVDRINELILSEQYYSALKLAKRLIDIEQEVVERVSESAECV